MRTRNLVAAILLALTGAAAASEAQSRPRDLLTPERRRVLDELARRYYWPDQRTVGGVEKCQVRVDEVCVSDHETVFGTQLLDMQNGSPRPRESAPGADSNSVDIPDRLLELAASAPDNGWETGHLAYIYSYGHTLNRALEVVRGCRGTASWCTALHAFVLHSYSRFGEADSLFSAALSAMPAAQQCRWRDISMLLGEPARSEYTALGCADRARFENRFWVLSDPLYMLPGNDRRSEHFARRVVDSLFTGARTPFARRDTLMLWDSTMTGIVMRYGLASHWIVPISGGETHQDYRRWVHLHTPSYHFVPGSISALASAGGGGASPAPALSQFFTREQFRTTIPLDSARERYHPEYDYVTDLLNSQTVALPRGDSLLVLGAMRLGREPVSKAGPFTAGMYLAGESRLVASRSSPSVKDRAQFAATVPRGDLVVGLEAFSDNYYVAARTRYSLRSPAQAQLVWLSQPLLLDAAGELPRRASDAATMMLGSERVVAGSDVGLYWEISNVPAGTPAQFAARVVRTDAGGGGIFSRIAGLFGGGAGSGSSIVRWSEPVTFTGGFAGHSVVVNLRSLRAGKYELFVDLTLPGGVTSSPAREIEIVRSDPAPPDDIFEVLRQTVPKPLVTAPSPGIRDKSGRVVKCCPSLPQR